MVLCSLHLHIYVGKERREDQESELWNGTSINQSSDKIFSQINQFRSSHISRWDNPYFLTSHNFMKRKCNQLVVREKIKSPYLLHFRFNYASISKVIYQSGMMMHSRNPAFRRRSGVQGELGYKRHCVTKPEITNNEKNIKHTSIQPLVLYQSGLNTRTELIHCEHNQERIKLSFQKPYSPIIPI